MAQFGQLVLLAALLACVSIAAIIFSRLSVSDRPKLLLFLLIEILIYIPVAVLLWVYAGPPGSVSGFIMVSVLLTMLANVPVAFVAKCIELVVGRRPEPGQGLGSGRSETADPRAQSDAAGRNDGREER
jgi:hypothetical protein